MHSKLRSDFGCPAMKCERWAARRQVDDFEIAPRDAAVPSSAERLHARFLRGEAGSVTFEAIGFAVGVGNFTGSKDSFEETAAVARDSRFDARDFTEVYAGTEDHCNQVSLPSAVSNIIVTGPSLTSATSI